MMEAILSLVSGGPQTFLAGLAAAIVAAIALFFKGRLDGAKANQAKHDAAESAAVQEAKRIDDAVAGNSPDKNREDLAKWSSKRS